jgi:hypothetical protein
MVVLTAMMVGPLEEINAGADLQDEFTSTAIKLPRNVIGHNSEFCYINITVKDGGYNSFSR